MKRIIKTKEGKTKWPLSLGYCFQERVPAEWWGMLHVVAKFISFNMKFHL